MDLLGILVAVTSAVRVTPPPCSGINATACPYYWQPIHNRFYEVWINDAQSYVYQFEIPSKCIDGTGGSCAREWNVKSQSFTSASVDFSQGDVCIKVRTRLAGGSGRLARKPFKQPRVASKFNQGSPVKWEERFGEYIFNVSSPGHFSVELFGQDDLKDALLVFLDDVRDESSCPTPISDGRLYHFTGPGVINPSNPSWTPEGYEPTGYYSFDSLQLGAHDVVCVDRGAVVQSIFEPLDECNNHGATVQGFGIVTGTSAIGGTPLQNKKPLIRLCGTNVSAKGVTLVNAIGTNLELNPYWAAGYYAHAPPKGASIQNVKVLSTWWYSTDGLYAGPAGHVANSFTMVNDDSLKPMVSDVLIEDCTVWQGDNGWAIMFGWNVGNNEHGMVVRDVHVLHVGHHSDGYCYPCTAANSSCHGGVGPHGFCDATTSNYQGYRAVIGAIYGEPGSLSNVDVDGILVSGPIFRAFSIAATWNLFGRDPVGSLHNWTFGQSKAVVFEMAQPKGIKSKIWATGPGFQTNPNNGTVYNLYFPQLIVEKTRVTEDNWQDTFAIGSECDPQSHWGTDGNVGTITWG